MLRDSQALIIHVFMFTLFFEKFLFPFLSDRGRGIKLRDKTLVFKVNSGIETRSESTIPASANRHDQQDPAYDEHVTFCPNSLLANNVLEQ